MDLCDRMTSSLTKLIECLLLAHFVVSLYPGLNMSIILKSDTASANCFRNRAFNGCLLLVSLPSNRSESGREASEDTREQIKTQRSHTFIESQEIFHLLCRHELLVLAT